VHDLSPTTALRGNGPRQSETAGITITEVTGLALASVAARLGQEAACRARLAELLGAAPPEPGTSREGTPWSAFWTGPDQWMLCAPLETHEEIASMLRTTLRGASVTEQTDGWSCFDVEGGPAVAMFERLCPVPVRRMATGDVQRTTIDHLGAFVWCRARGQAFRVLGPRSAAGSLWHALGVAAASLP
jgi:sarcosine oxidase subunit gamma